MTLGETTLVEILVRLSSLLVNQYTTGGRGLAVTEQNKVMFPPAIPSTIEGGWRIKSGESKEKVCQG